MIKAAPREDPLADPPIFIWLWWYFTQGWLSILTIPLFLFLAFGTYISLKHGFIIFIALVRVTNAVFGHGGAALAIGFSWILAWLPLAFYFSLLKHIPGAWLRRDVNMKMPAKLGMTVGILILFTGLAELVFMGDSKVISWIADRNPCASARVGIIGEVPPSPDCR